MLINGKEMGMMYTVGAHCKFNTLVAKRGNEISFAEAQIEKALIMHEEWARVNKIPEGKRVTKSDLYAQPKRAFDELVALMDAQEKSDTETTIEAVGSKNAKSAEANA